MGQPIVWSDETLLEFIRDVERNPMIWDPNDHRYSRQRTKNEAWTRLGAQYRADPDELKRKWNSLQASYRRERTKVRTGKRSRWFCYQPMSFLGMDTRKEVKVEKEEETQDTNFSEDSPQNAIESSEMEMYTPDVQLTTYNNHDGASVSIVPSETSFLRLSLTQGTQTSSKRRRDSSDSEATSVNDRLQEDQFETAGKNVIAKLKILPKPQRILAERLIYDVLLEAEMGTLTRESKLQI